MNNVSSCYNICKFATFSGEHLSLHSVSICIKERYLGTLLMKYVILGRHTSVSASMSRCIIRVTQN